MTYTINRVTSSLLLALIFLQFSQCSAENVVLQTQTTQPSQNVTLFFNITVNGYFSLRNILPSSPESPENAYEEDEVDSVFPDSSLSQDIVFIENTAGLKNVSCSSNLATGFTYVDNHGVDKQIASSLIDESGKSPLDFIITTTLDYAASILKDNFETISESEMIPRAMNMCLYYVKFQKSHVKNSYILFNDQSKVFVVVLEPKEALANENILLAKKLDRNCIMRDMHDASKVAGYKILEAPDNKMIILFFPLVKEQAELQNIIDFDEDQNDKGSKLEDEEHLGNLVESSNDGDNMVVLSFPEASTQRQTVDMQYADLEQMFFHLKGLLKGLEQLFDAEGEEPSSSNKVTIENLTPDELDFHEVPSFSSGQVGQFDDALLEHEKFSTNLLKQYTPEASGDDEPENVVEVEDVNEVDLAYIRPEDAEDYQVINATSVLKAVDQNISRHEKDCRYSFCEETRIQYSMPLSSKVDTKYSEESLGKSKFESKSKLHRETIELLKEKLKENQMKRAKEKRKLSSDALRRYMKEVELLGKLRDKVFTRN